MAFRSAVVSVVVRMLMLAAMLIGHGVALAEVRFEVSFDAANRSEPATGRLIVLLRREDAKLPPGTRPIDGPFWDDPQPLYGVDVAGAAAGTTMVVDDKATAFLGRTPSTLPPGKYVAQAVLNTGAKLVSNWRRADGSLYTREPVAFEIGEGKASPLAVKLELDAINRVEPLPKVEGVEWVEIKSELLSKFHGRDVMLRAGVVLPRGYDPAGQTRYAAVYEVPGFGGDHRGAIRKAEGVRRAKDDSAEAALARRAFWIVLDPESANGHTLFADSANNGPCGAALVKELIPAIEAKYRLHADAAHRLLRGHSSGGWSTIWLAITYPDVFGACWSTSPDPVCFEQFQTINVYKDASAFVDAKNDERPSVRRGGKHTLTVREESGAEDVVGPDNTSGGQWDSWQAVWCPRNANGNPAGLWDPATGLVDRAIAEAMKPYDIVALLRARTGELGPLFKQRIRIAVGDQDNFFLELACDTLKRELDGLSFLTLPEGNHGYVVIVPGADHGSIFGTPLLRGFSKEMLDHLNRVDGVEKAP
ncbi:MAG: alpha/beta hydrolase-fold protein [Planctomycetota bacterium]|nr:alpha/beta hydrolase-fold protein [Planctomycetota bacterium]